MYTERKKFYQKIEQERNSKVIAYVTSDRQGMGSQIGTDAPDIFLEHLDRIGKANKISLIIYTCGGNTLAAWNIVNLIREFCSELEIIVPNKCRSAGTLICLGANNIVMSKQATLGPIDPSITGPLSPVVPGTNPPQKLGISVESVKGYFSLLSDELGVKSGKALSAAYNKLTEHIHPLVLGDVYRSQKQIQMLAEKLLRMSYSDKQKIKKIVSFLCSDSGSHDYTISRTEARSLGLHIESPTQEIYEDMKSWFIDTSRELEFSTPYDPARILGAHDQIAYSFKRCLIESVDYGQDVLVSEGILEKKEIRNGPTKQIVVSNSLSFEGWRHN